MPRETIVLIAGLIVGFALFAVAILNYTGAETIELRAGREPGSTRRSTSWSSGSPRCAVPTGS